MVRSASRTPSHPSTWLVAALVLFISACSKPVERVEIVRPVRTVTVAPAENRALVELSGEIQPRYESRLGFRVGGKLIGRQVEIGSVVKRGQLLMQLDPADLQLAQSQAKAAVSAADSTLSLARAEVERYRELRQKNFVSQALLDTKEAAYRSALAGHEQAAAALKIQSNQSGYNNLYADADGVITGIDAEVGQVVAAGAPVVRLARTGEKEVRASIPEDQVETLRQVSALTVRTWANPQAAIEGKLRELSPVADPATRTYTARISLPKAGAEVLLGMTATVQFAVPAPAAIRLPLSALVRQNDGTAVWVVESGKVSLVAVQVAGTTGNELLVASGLNPGQVVVTAGVNQLQAGQKVSLLDAELSTKTSMADADKPVAGAGK